MMIAPVKSSEITADGAVNAAPGALCGVALTAGSDAATLIIYDNPAAASGDKLITLKAAANTSVAYSPSQPINASKGLYADITGTGPAAYVAYW